MLEKQTGIGLITSGVNQSLNRKYQEKYTNVDLEEDLYRGYVGKKIEFQERHEVNAGDVIINVMNNRAAVVSDVTKGLGMAQNFIKIVVDNKNVYSWYLCYKLNESDEVARQFLANSDGNVVRRMRPSTLKSLKVSFPDFDEQVKIGDAYRHMLMMVHQEKLRIEEIQASTLQVLKQVDEKKAGVSNG
ncbi:hypothetical protein FC40_GL000283 [Ligilactobacillus hayakitensis DSM 18933 = JCM 14209]|uniref:Type I restriction modification DNA specificity domain-containing protein n=1 Tax=Ligilactobacillus hayakitensis DSM 18933 = JCM 14209 TaxID=1423755 RepID=A0A0R1WN12_9LACO|nr:restriction endonuclease subunit S [Ligilactobacillus hayakitensis]KRM19304.1 hypothetical protein FC40_GL000283 [Ligilactobacillus hayakitensis DSM 18933 = JCM 14209]